MAVATRICKVCGAEYEACHTIRRIDGVYRWQDVACSPEHGSIYLAMIEESRGIKPSVKQTQVEVELFNDDEDDNLFEEEFEDSAEELTIEQ